MNIPQINNSFSIQAARDDGAIHQYSGLIAKSMTEPRTVILLFLKVRPFEFIILVQIDPVCNLDPTPRSYLLDNFEVQFEFAFDVL
ncbi:hypothetical protein D3C85_1501560 [compost metagenome]